MTTEAVYTYLKRQNRPYSIIDIAANLDKEKYSKAEIQRSLDKLVNREKVFVKTNGKQKVFCISQRSKGNLEELKSLEREWQERFNDQLKKLHELYSQVTAQETALKSLTCGLTLEEAEKERNRLKKNNEKLTLKLEKLMKASGTEDLSEVKRKIENRLNVYNLEYSKRKRICTDILDCILESYPGSKKQLCSEIGIDLA